MSSVMYIPATISSNSLSVYHTSTLSNFHQHSTVAKLKVLCLNAIISNWEVSPIINELPLADDARYVLDHLPSKLPYNLAVSKIHDEIYWRRAFKNRWPGKITPVKAYNLDYEHPNQFQRGLPEEMQELVKRNTWKCFYIERHLQELLEHLHPEEFNPKEMKELLELSKDYILRLKLNQLQSPIEYNIGRIPLNEIIPKLIFLKQLQICFKQNYVGDNFSWHVVQTTDEDIENLSIGLRSCNLHILRIINSDINCRKLTKIAWGLLNNKQLQILDVSHCKIGDNGIVAICRLMRDVPLLKELILTNNLIGAKGVEFLCYTLSQDVCLKMLNFSLNPLKSTSAKSLAKMLIYNKQLTCLNLSSCGFLASDAEDILCALQMNDSVLELDLSNNKLSNEMGEKFRELCQTRNTCLRKLDLRMTTIEANIILDVDVILRSNNRRTNNDRLNNDQQHQSDVDIEKRLETVFD